MIVGDQGLDDFDPLRGTGALHLALEVLLESRPRIAGDELLARMARSFQPRIRPGVGHDDLLDNHLLDGLVVGRGVVLAFVVEHEDLGGLLGIHAKLDDALQADPKAVAGGKADVFEVVSLAAAIDQRDLGHVGIQILRARFQGLGLHAAGFLSLGHDDLVGRLGKRRGNQGLHALEAGGDRHRIVQLDDLGITVVRYPDIAPSFYDLFVGLNSQAEA